MVIPTLDYLEANQRLPSLGPQSSFRSGHSTETALLHVLSDVLAAIDRSDLAPLVLFDLCAAFDTVELTIGSCWNVYGGRQVITGRAVILPVKSYTQLRSCRGGSTSRLTVMGFGIPQGSVLGSDRVPAIHG
jgi:hypothetical protein